MSSVIETAIFAISPITILLFIASFLCVVNISFSALAVDIVQIRVQAFFMFDVEISKHGQLGKSWK